MNGYLGSKGQAGVPQRIIGQMPPHSVYVESFYGSGEIFHRKLPADRNVIIDRDGSLFRPVFLNPAMAGTEAHIGNAMAILPKLALPADAVVYCDPPYLLSTRTSSHRYKFEMTDDDHMQLLTLLQGINCRVLLSGYPSKMYAQKLKSWRCISYQTRTRGRTLIECLWMNYPQPTELHDWRFFGSTHRERVTIKRFAARFVNRLEKYPPLKRNFVLNLIDQRRNGR